MVRISLPPAHHHRVPLGDGGNGAQADGLGQLVELSCLGKLDQSDVIDDGITTILPVSFIILVDNKVLKRALNTKVNEFSLNSKSNV